METVKISSQISLSRLRAQAKARLQANQPQSYCLSSEIELGALNLLEEYVKSDPEAAIVEGTEVPGEGMTANYARALALSAARMAGASGSHALSPALTKVLEEVRWESVKEQNPGLELMGRLDEVARANKATSSKESMEWGVKITGHWQPQQLENVNSAVQELGRKTGTKALNLLREVHLRTHLGSLPNGPILGLTRTVGAIALEREQSEHKGATRWLVFHEVGHQLDRYLSGSSRKFRSHQGDSPFGKSSEPSDYVDSEQVGSAHEDFADCHARAIYDLDQIEAQPDLYLHARGPLGEKMAWILEHGYGLKVPPATPEFEARLESVERGESPFRDRTDFHRSVNLYLDRPALLDESQRAWLEQHF